MTANAARDFTVRCRAGTIDGQYSLPYAFAVTVPGLPPGSAWFNQAVLEDRPVWHLAEVVRLVVDLEIDRAFREQRMLCRVTLQLTGDGALRGERAHLRGGPRHLLTPDETLKTFHTLCDLVLRHERAWCLREGVTTLDRMENIRALAPWLVPREGAARPPPLSRGAGSRT